MAQKISPNILVRMFGHQHYNTKDVKRMLNTSDPHKSEQNQKIINRSNFYRSKGTYNALEYYARKNAVEEHSIETAEVVDKLIETTNESISDIIGYAGERPGSTGLWNSDGDIEKTDLEKIRKTLQQTESIVWDGIISFTESYGLQNCNSKAKAHALLVETLPSFFEAANLDISNLEWYGAYHMNTDNPHIHLVFWEKKPININSKGDINFSKFKLPKKSFDVLKEKIAFQYRENKSSYFLLRDDARLAIQHDVKKTISYKTVLNLQKKS